jgi:hypothetical protein
LVLFVSGTGLLVFKVVKDFGFVLGVELS